MGWPFFKTYKVKCPDGKTYYVYRDINDVLPLSLNELETNIKAKTAVIEEIDAELDARYASKIKGLLYDLNSSYSNIMIDSRNAYLVYKSEPCSSYVEFRKQIAQITDDHKNLKILETRIRGLIDLARLDNITETEFLSSYRQIISQFDKYLPLESPKGKIEEAIELSQDWQESLDEDESEEKKDEEHSDEGGDTDEDEDEDTNE